MKRHLRQTRAYQFYSQRDYDYARPLRAMAQWVKRHPEVDVLSVNVALTLDDKVVVTLTVSDYD